MLTTDGQTDDGRQTMDAGCLCILNAHLRAFGSGELKARLRAFGSGELKKAKMTPTFKKVTEMFPIIIDPYKSF